MNYKKLLVAGVTFFVLLIVTVVSFQTYQKFLLTPERIIQKALVNVAQKQSLEYTGDVNMGFFQYRFSGASDNKGGAEGKSWSKVNMKLGATVSHSMESRLIDGSIYFRTGPSTNTFIGKTTPAEEWIKIDETAIRNRLEKVDGASPSWFYTGLAATKSEEELQQKLKLFDGYSLFETIEELKSVQLSGIENHHYAFTISVDQFKEITVAFREIEGRPYTEEELGMLDQVFDTMGAIRGEMWIDKKDMLLRKIVIKSEDVESDMIGNVIEVSPEEMTPEGIANVSGRKPKTPAKTPRLQLTLNLKNFDKPVKTSIPKYKEASPEEIEQTLSLYFPLPEDSVSREEAAEAAAAAGRRAGEALWKNE